MDKQSDSPPSLFQRLTRHWRKIAAAFLYLGVVSFSVKIYHQIEKDGSAEWPEGSLCTDKMFLEIRPGMSHADVFRHFPVADGYTIEKILNEDLMRWVESGDAEHLVNRVLQGDLELEEWIVEKEGSGADARIWFNADGHLVVKDCGCG